MFYPLVAEVGSEHILENKKNPYSHTTEMLAKKRSDNNCEWRVL